MITAGGVTWARAGEAAAELGDDVTEAMVRAWGTRPQVRSRLVGRERWYALDDLQDVELSTRLATRGRPRRQAV